MTPLAAHTAANRNIPNKFRPKYPPGGVGLKRTNNKQTTNKQRSNSFSGPDRMDNLLKDHRCPRKVEYSYGWNADRQMALGGALLQNARVSIEGLRDGSNRVQRPACKACSRSACRRPGADQKCRRRVRNRSSRAQSSARFSRNRADPLPRVVGKRRTSPQSLRSSSPSRSNRRRAAIRSTDKTRSPPDSQLQRQALKRWIFRCMRRNYCGLSASSKVRVSAITSSAFAEVSGQRKTPCAVNCAPRLALRLTSFIIAAGSTVA